MKLNIVLMLSFLAALIICCSVHVAYADPTFCETGTDKLEIFIEFDGSGSLWLEATDIVQDTTYISEISSGDDVWGTCDFVVDFGQDATIEDEHHDWAHGILYEIKFMYNLQVVGNYYFYNCINNVAAFYCIDDANSGNPHTDVFFYFDSNTDDHVRIYPDIFKDKSDLVSYYSDDNWVYPYDIGVLCRTDPGTAGEESCMIQGDRIGVFISPQPGPSYTFADTDLTNRDDVTWTWDSRNLKFPSGGTLTITETLNATGTALTSVGSWDGIYFASGSSGTLDDVTISGTSGTAITINNSSPTIRNSNITSAGKGINVSNGSSFPEIHNNDISTGGTYGVRFYDAGGYLYDNRITGSGNGEGVTAYYFADPLLDEPILGVRGDNDISGYYWGLRAQLSSTMWTGVGYNCVTGTTVDAQALDDGTIYAENNWWDTDGPQISFDESSYIDYTPYLSSDPCGASKAGQTSPTPLAAAESGTDLRDQVMEAKQNAIEGRYEEAVHLFKSVVASDAESGAAATALIELGHFCEKMKDGALKSYLQDAAASDTRHAATIKGSLIGCHRAFGDDDRALAAARSLVQDHPGSWQAFYGSLSEFYMHLDAERYGEASAMLERLHPERETEMEAVSFARELLEKETRREGMNKTSDAPGPIATVGTEEETSFIDAESYPNPFNPRTVIRFTLSDERRVRLAVFDLLGRELAVLVDERRDAGHHEVYFDASDYATGTYLYRLSTAHASVSGLMQLVK